MGHLGIFPPQHREAIVSITGLSFLIRYLSADVLHYARVPKKLRMLLTHRKLLQSKAIAIDNDLRGLCVTSASRWVWWKW
jgi:hypothetical protein